MAQSSSSSSVTECTTGPPRPAPRRWSSPPAAGPLGPGPTNIPEALPEGGCPEPRRAAAGPAPPGHALAASGSMPAAACWAPRAKWLGPPRSRPAASAARAGMGARGGAASDGMAPAAVAGGPPQAPEGLRSTSRRGGAGVEPAAVGGRPAGARTSEPAVAIGPAAVRVQGFMPLSPSKSAAARCGVAERRGCLPKPTRSS
mmetsp:Transcript_103167/g.322554  ORF Transcript_103167/g.322554 Transcript_103167/m.322554 type:complete len:201 (+) Transcript_103167:70-672(+)